MDEERTERKGRAVAGSVRPESRGLRPELPSLLPRGLRGLLAVALALAALLFANTVYLLLNRLADAVGWELFAVGETSLPALFQAMVLTHTGLGLLLAALMLGFFLAHLPVVWRRRHGASILSGIAFVAVGLTLVVTGLFILTAAASRDHRWAWWAHVAAAALLPLGYAAHRLVSYVRPPRERLRRFGIGVAAVTGVLVVWHLLAPRDIRLTPEAEAALAGGGLGGGAGRTDRAVNRDSTEPFDPTGFVPIGFVPPESPYFPSPATTRTGSWIPDRILLREDARLSPEALAPEIQRIGFVAGERIGADVCARCHADIVEQWASSAHRFASFNNPFYGATVRHMRRTATGLNPWVERHLAVYGEHPPTDSSVARAKSQWCAGCHDPALLFTGRMSGPVGRGEPAAQAGITCLACHRISATHGITGNGNYDLEDGEEDPYLFAGAREGSVGAWLHDAALKARPTVHRRRMLKPFFRSAEYCATCHKVSLSEPVNNYRWLRGQDEYDNWHDSGIARNASRTFYLPPEVRVCQDCHMPPEPAPLGDVSARDGTVRSHRFLAVNTALPFVRGDTATLRRIEEFLRDEKLRVEIFALRREAEPEDGLVMDLHRTAPALRPGERIVFDVVVRNLGVGHTFPGGTNDSNEGWLELTVEDAAGREIARSGWIGPDGHLDPMAHSFRAVVLDAEGRRIQRRNAQDIHVTAASNVIGPGTADVAHYAFTVPDPPPAGGLRVRARLLWRKFDRAYTEFAFRENPEGFRRFDRVPDLPVTEIAADELLLPVGASGPGALGPGEGGRPSEEPPGVADWVRYNDFGIGLLLQGNTRLAALAFEQVERLVPERVDGPLNLARTAFREGDLEAAYAHLERSEAIAPGDPRAAWVWGVVLQEDGRYEEAALAYRRVLEAFPEDRAAWRNLGRTLYLGGEYEEALSAFDRVLEIDPEDRIAHYHRMLILRALGREPEAAAAAAAYEYYRIDESALEVTREYRLRNPGVNLMAQPVHTHELRAPEARAPGTVRSESRDR